MKIVWSTAALPQQQRLKAGTGPSLVTFSGQVVVPENSYKRGQ
jgi:hypothetical protein